MFSEWHYGDPIQFQLSSSNSSISRIVHPASRIELFHHSCHSPCAVCPAGCVNGNCSAPGVCDCTSGWSGTSCNTAGEDLAAEAGECMLSQPHIGLRLPRRPGLTKGVFGTTGDPLPPLRRTAPCPSSCAVCPAGCVNGNCSAPGVCTCALGWSGTNCSTPGKALAAAARGSFFSAQHHWPASTQGTSRV
jgi:hypothetical protein